MSINIINLARGWAIMMWGGALGLPVQAHMEEVWKEVGPAYKKDFQARTATPPSATAPVSQPTATSSRADAAPKAVTKPATQPGAPTQTSKTKRVRVLMAFSNQELLQISKVCAKQSATRSSLISAMVTWDVAWPVFKQTWDACIDDVVSHYPEAERLKQMEKADFDVRIDYPKSRK